MSQDRHEFGNGDASAVVLAQGAELCSLQAGGLEVMWPALPAWPRHAPVLFPTIGRMVGDTLRHDGRTYRMTQHGFARDRQFEWVERTADGCVLALSDDAATRALYPFGFRFTLGYALSGTVLRVTYTVENTGGAVLPASMGAHPAFRWPLVPGVAKDAYALTFERAEPELLRGVSDGLLTPADRASPMTGRVIALSDGLFAADALIWTAPTSRTVRFAAASGPALTVAWEGFPQLGVWMKPGSDFLCIEPWHGMASPADFDGDVLEKPWMMLLQPGESRSAWYSVRVENV